MSRRPTSAEAALARQRDSVHNQIIDAQREANLLTERMKTLRDIRDQLDREIENLRERPKRAVKQKASKRGPEDVLIKPSKGDCP